MVVISWLISLASYVYTDPNRHSDFVKVLSVSLLNFKSSLILVLWGKFSYLLLEVVEAVID